MAHLHEKIDFTVETFVVHAGRVLLRLHDKYKIWLSVGGHVELDEDPVQAAVREVKEEVGLDVALIGTPAPTQPASAEYQELLAPRFLNRHRISDAHEHITLVYFATSPTADVRPGEGDRSDTWKWFAAEELDDPQYRLRPSIAYYAKEALRAAA